MESPPYLGRQGPVGGEIARQWGSKVQGPVTWKRPLEKARERQGAAEALYLFWPWLGLIEATLKVKIWACKTRSLCSSHLDFKTHKVGIDSPHPKLG